MPLVHSASKKALGENIAAERRAGKPEKQAVAIAFSEKRRAMAKKMKKHGNSEKYIKAAHSARYGETREERQAGIADMKKYKHD